MLAIFKCEPSCLGVLAGENAVDDHVRVKDGPLTLDGIKVLIRLVFFTVYAKIKVKNINSDSVSLLLPPSPALVAF